jgi:dTDP-4-dehydrorhamnose 3,5-epimerase
MFKNGIITGNFDVIHPGYVRMFKEAKSVASEVVVLLHDDPSIERPDKLKPVLSLDDRIELLSSIKYIDKIIPYSLEKDLEDLILKIKPEVRFLGDDYRGRTNYTGYDKNQKLYFFDRSHGWSTTSFKKSISDSLFSNYEKEFKLFELNKYEDSRGYFQETFNKKISSEIGCKFVQDNESVSSKGVIRGMHYQWDSPMGKLVRCSRGEILDVIVDIRKNSEDYGKVYYFYLSQDNSTCLWVPPGFAHGFQALTDDCVVNYKCSSYYNKEGEGGINPLDPDFNIIWENIDSTISEKDKSAISFSEYNKDVKFW